MGHPIDILLIKFALDVEVLDVEGVVFNEFAAGFNVFAHERGEDGFGFGNIF